MTAPMHIMKTQPRSTSRCHVYTWRKQKRKYIDRNVRGEFIIRGREEGDDGGVKMGFYLGDD